MRVKRIAIVLRKDGFFHLEDRKVKAVYAREGYGVMVFLDRSPIDEDFNAMVWVPSNDELQEILEKMKESDELTWKLRGGRGWFGNHPYFKMHEWVR